MFSAYIRAETSDGRRATVDVADLDNHSFKRFISSLLVENGLLVGLKDESGTPLRTELTKDEAER